MEIAICELSIYLLVCSLGRAQLGAVGRASGVHLDCGQSSGAGGREQPQLEVCRGGGSSLQTGVKLPRLCSALWQPCPFTGHVQFTFLEMLSLKSSQDLQEAEVAPGGL